MKKWTKLGIGLLCATLITFGVRSIAGVSNADEASQTVTGTVKTIDDAHGEVTVTNNDGADKTVPLSKSVWVFLDNHKAQMSDIGTGFKVDLILNGKKQAAYIKAITITVTDKAGSTQAPTGTTTPTAATPAAPAASITPASPAPAQAVTPLATADAAAPWDKLHIKIEGNGFKMDIHDKGDHNNGTSMIKMKPKGHDGLFLKDADAEHWIRTLLAGIDLKSPNAQQQIGTAFANWFELDGIALNVNIEVEGKPAAAATSVTPAAPSVTPEAPVSTPAAPSITPEAPASAPAAPSSAPAAAAAPKVQITVSHNDDDDNEDDGDDDNKDKKEFEKQSKNSHVKVQIKNSPKAFERDHEQEKEHHDDNGKHKGGKGEKED